MTSRAVLRLTHCSQVDPLFAKIADELPLGVSFNTTIYTPESCKTGDVICWMLRNLGNFKSVDIGAVLTFDRQYLGYADASLGMSGGGAAGAASRERAAVDYKDWPAFKMDVTPDGNSNMEICLNLASGNPKEWLDCTADAFRLIKITQGSFHLDAGHTGFDITVFADVELMDGMFQFNDIGLRVSSYPLEAKQTVNSVPI